MKGILDRSIRQKITFVIMLVSAVVLLIACGALFAYQAWTIKKRFLNELIVTSEMVASNLAVAVMFSDEEKAGQLLAGLGTMPQITYAKVSSTESGKLAQFGEEDNDDGEFTIGEEDGSIQMNGNRVHLATPVMREGRKHGMLHIHADFHAAYAGLMKLYAVTLFVVLSSSLLLTYLLAGPLQHLVTSPILKLAATARQIAEKKDYSVRAEKSGGDEVGTLTDAFNQMLGQIHAQDTALQTAQHDLTEQLASLEREVAMRKYVQAEQDKLIAINEATPDFVGSTDRVGDLFYLNRAARRMVGLEDETNLHDIRISNFYPEWVDKIIQEEAIPTAIREGSWDGETALIHRDGHEIYVSQVIIAHKDAKGKVEGFSTVMRDISERKATEEALRQSQQKLLESSRLAGMAEVATSVLHNVGNVLNSVNVSGNVISERLHGSKVSVLAKVAEMINTNKADLGGFVTNDPRGKRIPDLVSTLSDALKEEHTEMLAEVGVITKHIGHIKEIVAMQQSYAKVGGVIEQLEVEDLVHDALRMNAASLARHNVRVVQEFESVPKVQVDRHKVLQILVNLLSNAKHAVDDAGNEDKQVTVQVHNNGGKYVKISVKDNGIGIKPENLTRIFSHGFTTKKTGHGFGLHSGALAATEAGGALTVHSDGLGTGATFTLALPINAPSSIGRENSPATQV